ncbi:SusC/RagA family TonB-linked outer membrane protein [Larkinella insperata]|uniref:SusC/RagA family TonB-linked outer membrane protein n=1 Tax=Larkinella insperata TaxID=332158 RepID=A0ABW3QEZ0_9BACT|nr:SusC/RagA family TonB-linked outer membrane protein [Larkinella insperata]
MNAPLAKDITGTVKDANGAGIPGVNIVIKGTTKGTTTNSAGQYSLTVDNNATVLIFSFIGSITQEIVVGDRSVIDVMLQEDSKQLNEVVVTALGIERNAKTLTYATQQIDGKKLVDVRDANFVNTLSGKVAGMVVTQGSSGPGSATRVVLRGNRSITGNNNALFVIDGVPVDNTVRGQVSSDFGGINGSDGANNINPDDIESMNVLKGPAASALYGSRAANGVIMITTKKGKAGKVSVDVNSGVQTESPFMLPKLQNTYGQGAGGKSSENAAASWGAPATTYPNNVKDFFRNAISTNNSVGIAGGTDKVQTYASYTHNYNQGILPNNDLVRHTLNLRLNSQITKRLTTDAKITYINQKVDNKPRSGEESSVTMNLYKVPRSVDLIGQYSAFEDANGKPTYWTSSGIYMNPYWTLNRTFAQETRNRVTALGSAKYDITDWLNVQGRLSYDWYTDRNSQSYSNNTLLFAGAGGSYQEFSLDQLERNMDVIISGNNKISNDFAITYNAGAGQTYNRFSQVGASTNGLSVANRFDLSFASALTQITGFSQKELQYVFGTASVSFRDYLTVDASVRNDWSSTLPPPYSYIYSSFGANFILSDAVKLPSWISFAKVRGSWAQVGNDAAPYSLAQTYVFSQGGTGGFISRSTQRPAENLKPEISSSTEIGADLRFLNGRLGVDFTYYNSNTVNQLLSLGLAPASGFATQFVNAGKINNKGFELTLTASPLKGNALTWDVSFNMARNINKIIELYPGIKSATLGGNTRTTTAVVAPGGSYGDLQAYGWAKDEQGRRLVNANGLPVVSAFQTIGNFNPKLTLGLNNTFSYKNFVLSFLVDGRVGGIMVSGTDGNLAYDGTAEYTLEHREGGWVLPGVTATGETNTKAVTAEQFWQTVSQGRYTWGEFFAYSTTNVRLRELSFGYNIPFPQNFFIKNARLSLTARNLFFLYRGDALMDIPGLKTRKLPFDPDVNISAANYQGSEYGALPSTRTVGLNLKLGF